MSCKYIHLPYTVIGFHIAYTVLSNYVEKGSSLWLNLGFLLSRSVQHQVPVTVRSDRVNRAEWYFGKVSFFLGTLHGHAIYNSAPFTLSHVRCAFVRFLADAENTIRWEILLVLMAEEVCNSVSSKVLSYLRLTLRDPQNSCSYSCLTSSLSQPFPWHFTLLFIIYNCWV